MTMPAICVENLGKKYLISHRQREQYQALRDVITGGFSSAFRRLVKGAIPAPREEEFWALSGVSFDVKPGERVGIIGRNGAGKSTLLKVLSRITEPTAGSVRIRGRVASLLEVGTGFHPELTGRENIFLNGAILGMQRAEIKRKFDEIVDFAEIERFLDTPVKRYSSGMYVRLAFAVAAHLEPEILVVDEVLAVGDAQFQKKCLGKMEAVGQEGRTVIFVSHNMEALLNLCTKGILLQGGRVIASGDAPAVVHHYLSQSLEQSTLRQWSNLETAPGNEKAKLVKAQVKSSCGACDVFTSDAGFLLEFVYYNMLPGENNLDVTYHLTDERGVLVYVGSTAFSRYERFQPGYLRATCRVPGDLLNEGTYTVSRLLLVKDRGSIVYEENDVLTFHVVHPADCREGWVGKKEGVIRPKLDWDFCSVVDRPGR